MRTGEVRAGGAERIIPALGWLVGYRRADWRGDLIAGLTTGVMLVPQAMAYALLAGLSPAIGLYAATLPLIAYALLGTSRHLAVGPVAIISLLVAAAAAQVAAPGTPEYALYAAQLALLVGLLQVALGVLRLGAIANYLSHSVITGFTAAAALVILLSQVKHLLGVSVPGTESTLGLVVALAGALPQAHPLVLGLGLGSLGWLLLARARWPQFPASMVLVVAGTLVVWGLGLAQRGVPIVGEVPAGLPALRLPWLDLATLTRLLPVALTIVFVGFTESIAVAQMIAAREHYRLEPSREFVALGAANVAAGLVGAYPVTGGFSRTAVNYQAGARTGLASLVTAAFVVLTLLLFTPLFTQLPQVVLAAVVVAAVLSLIDLRSFRRLFAVKPGDGWVALATFGVTLAVNVEAGVLAGVALSLAQFIWRSSHPHIAELGYVAAEKAYLNVQRFPEAQRPPQVLVVRIDASLYFANMGQVAQWLRERLLAREEVKWVLMDWSGVNEIDASAVHDLQELMASYHDRGIIFLFAAVKGPVRDVLERAGWDEDPGRWRTCRSLGDALSHLGLEPDLTGACPSPPHIA
jgi:SulP family sulfate permease